MNNEFYLGIDTSNYKTSVAVVDNEKNIICNESVFLNVKKGERGLRQSVALFQHIKQLPTLIDKCLLSDEIRNNLKCVSVSTKPRNIEGSYMPVFLAGETVAKTISSSLHLPLHTFSHQEGHIKAVKAYSSFDKEYPLIVFHFSGGTTEALLVEKDKITIIGGTKDISYGQVIDRIGVFLGMNFPAGKEMDSIAYKTKEVASCFSKIKVKNCFINLSGVETQALNLINNNKYSTDIIISSLFKTLSNSILDIINDLKNEYNINKFMFTGGVSSSEYIKNYIMNNLDNDVEIQFGIPSLSSDNAVGIALLGGEYYGY